MATRQLTLKLLIDTKSEKVLLAEAGKDVIDFLFNILRLPIGSAVKLLTIDKMVGCLGNLYKSVETLDSTYMQSNQNKTILLNPTTPSLTSNNLFLTEPSSTPSTAPKKYYRCPYNYNDCRNYHTEVENTACPRCGNGMSTEIQLVGQSQTSGTVVNEQGVGFVKGVVTYSVMDDLTVMPMSTISSITLLNKFNVKDAGLLEERIVNMGLEEGLELLKASLQSKTVLTDVFLKKKPPRAGPVLSSGKPMANFRNGEHMNNVRRKKK